MIPLNRIGDTCVFCNVNNFYHFIYLNDFNLFCYVRACPLRSAAYGIKLKAEHQQFVTNQNSKSTRYYHVGMRRPMHQTGKHVFTCTQFPRATFTVFMLFVWG